MLFIYNHLIREDSIDLYLYYLFMKRKYLIRIIIYFDLLYNVYNYPDNTHV